MRDLNTSRSRTAKAVNVTPTAVITQTNYNHNTGSKTGEYDVSSNESYGFSVCPSEKVTNDNVTTNYVERRRNGEILVNDYQNFTRTIETPNGYFHGICYYPDNDGLPYREWEGSAAVGHLVTGIDRTAILGDFDFDSEISRVVTRLYANMSDAQWLAPVAVAEMHKTVSMFKSIYGQVLHLMQSGASIRRKILKGLLTPAKAAQLWLQVRYGLRPLFHDIVDSMTALASLVEEEQHKTRIVTEFNVRDDTSDSEFSQAGRRLGHWRGLTTETNKVDVSGGMIIQPKLTGLDAINARVGGTEMLLTAWELVPFSFIVDWFLNTGDFFASLQPRVGVKVLGSWAVVRESATRQIHLTEWASNDAYKPWYQDPILYGLIDRTSETRTTRYANLQRPFLPQVNIRLDWWKTLDILALLKGINFSEWRV